MSTFQDFNRLSPDTAACQSCETLAICGDYDADGMTSTALLIKRCNSLVFVRSPFPVAWTTATA